jgi:hypothetical protein
MTLRISGGFNLAQTSRPDDFLATDAFDLGNDLSLLLGSHQMSFGAGINSTHHRGQSSAWAAGEMRFDTTFTGAGLGDFLTGQMVLLTMSGTGNHEPQRWFPRMYMTDAWRATPNLTLNYGVRWEPFMPENRRNGTAYNFDYKRFQQGIKSTVFLNAPAGFYYAGDPGFPEGSSGVRRNWWQFSPRFGLAWDVSGDGRTSIRASYGYSYEIVPMEWTGELGNASPFGQKVEVSGANFDDPWRNVAGGNPHPFTLNPNIAFGQNGPFQSQPYDYRGPRTSTWNLSIQRQLPADSILSMAYMGNIVTHLVGQDAINPATYFPGGPCVLPDGRSYNPCSTAASTLQRRKLSLERYEDGQFIGPLMDRTPQGTQRYTGLLVSVSSRATEGVNISTNYTWSHCVGDYTEDVKAAGPNSDQTYTIPGNRRNDWGNCNTDRRHIFNLTTVMETPTFANPTLRLIGTGWRLSGIYKRSSGSPLSATLGEDVALSGSSIRNQRANQVLGSVYADRAAGPLELYLNPQAVARPALGTYGSMGRNNIVGPGTWDLDLALSRIFNVHESDRLEFRAEAYNLTNSFRAVNPTTTITSGQFGQIRASREPRIMQFALKYIF